MLQFTIPKASSFSSFPSFTTEMRRGRNDNKDNNLKKKMCITEKIIFRKEEHARAFLTLFQRAFLQEPSWVFFLSETFSQTFVILIFQNEWQQ